MGMERMKWCLLFYFVILCGSNKKASETGVSEAFLIVRCEDE